MSLIHQFFEKREYLFNRIRDFELKHTLSLIKRLENEQNEVQFLSMVTEIQFGLFFDQYATSMKYEASIENKTPDWLIEMNEQIVIAEVVRLNPSASDKEELDFDDSLIDVFGQIKVGALLHFDYDEKTISRSEIDILDCKRLIEQWLFKRPNLHETITLFNSLTIRLVSYSDKIDHVGLFGGGGSIKCDYRRLNSEKSALLEKSRKYSTIINQHAHPYIICLYLHFHTWFDKEDVYRTLYGLSTEHREETVFYSHLIKDALYYSTEGTMKHVSGILVRQYDEHTYFHNFSNNNLNVANRELLLKWQHPYE
jgi:hypothetical protein